MLRALRVPVVNQVSYSHQCLVANLHDKKTAFSSVASLKKPLRNTSLKAHDGIARRTRNVEDEERIHMVNAPSGSVYPNNLTKKENALEKNTKKNHVLVS